MANLSFYFNDDFKTKMNFLNNYENLMYHACTYEANGESSDDCIRGPVKLILDGNNPPQIIRKDQLLATGEIDSNLQFIDAPENFPKKDGLKVEIKLPEDICHLRIERDYVLLVNTQTTPTTKHISGHLFCPDNDGCTGDIGSLSIISHECKPHLQACFGDPIWEMPNGEINEGDLLELTLPGVYNVTGQYSNACNVSATMELAEDFFVMPELSIDKSGPGSNACNLQENQLTLKSNTPSIAIDGLETQWRHSDGSSSQGNPTVTSTPGEHTAKIIYSGFCLEQTSDVACNPDIDVAATEKPSSLCEGGKELSICSEAQNIHWKKPDQLGLIATETLIADTPGTYTVTAVDSFNCQLEGSYQEDGVFLQEIENNTLYVPNAFSPNGDGNNDVFTAYSAVGSKITIVDFKVFSRWGELIYDKNNLQVNNPALAWDGKIKGEMGQQGTYTYKIVYKLPECEEKQLEGDVTLIR
ncbi:gliding motility-associated C-terminal domain-containing protein [bacterium]|nr:gliding motility-associated C-terminal domain-containing protein [bacterium]